MWTEEQLQNLLTVLKTELEYSEGNGVGLGVFRNKINRHYNSPAGRWVGHTNGKTGYRHLNIAGSKHYEHRLVWLWHNGTMPLYIDHIDGNKSNNVIGNLRECTHSQNHGNMGKPRTNSSGFKGVSKIKGGRKWRARIKVGGKEQSLGAYSTKEEAHEAYKRKAREVFGEFAKE